MKWTLTSLKSTVIQQVMPTSQLRNNAKRKKKTDLHDDYMEVQVSHIINKDKSGAELQVDKDRIKLLQDSQLEISQRYQTDVFAVRQQADTLQRELEKEVKSHADTVLVGSHVINNLRAELDTVCQKMAKEINVQQQETTSDVRVRQEEK